MPGTSTPPAEPLPTDDDRSATTPTARPPQPGSPADPGTGGLRQVLALLPRVSRWLVRTPWAVWTLVTINLTSSVAGYVYWYGADILAAPVYFWPFVPDSPLSATLWAFALLSFHRGKGGQFLGLLAVTGCIKYGLWADWYWFVTARLGHPYTLEGIVLSANHFGMVLQGVVLLPLLRPRYRTVLPVIAWYVANDFVDYVLGYYPRIPDMAGFAQVRAFALGSTVVLSAVWLFWAWRNERVRVVARP
jgi:uncharacterized membrane protein YpjA